MGNLSSWENLSKDSVLFTFSNTGTTDDGFGENHQILGICRVYWSTLLTDYDFGVFMSGL